MKPFNSFRTKYQQLIVMMMMIIDQEEIDHHNDDDRIRSEFEKLLEKFSTIKKQHKRIVNDMIQMENSIQQFELQSHRFRRKFLQEKNYSKTNNNDEDKNVSADIQPKYLSNQSDIIDMDVNEKSINFVDDDQETVMNIDHNFPKLNELNIDNIDSLSINTIDHLIDRLCEEARIDPRIINDDSDILFNSIIDDDDDEQQPDTNVANNIAQSNDDEDESMKTDDEYRSCEESWTLESPQLNYQTPFDSLSDVQEELLSSSSDQSSCCANDNDNEQTLNDISTVFASNKINENNDLKSQKSVSFDDSTSIDKNDDKENMPNNGNNDDDNGDNSGSKLRIDVVHDENDQKSFEFFIHDQNGQPIHERIILKPISKQTNNHPNDGKCIVNVNKHKHCNDDDDLPFHNHNPHHQLTKPRSPSLDYDYDDSDHGQSSTSISIDENNYDWRMMRNFWERRSLGPHYRYSSKKKLKKMNE